MNYTFIGGWLSGLKGTYVRCSDQLWYIINIQYTLAAQKSLVFNQVGLNCSGAKADKTTSYSLLSFPAPQTWVTLLLTALAEQNCCLTEQNSGLFPSTPIPSLLLPPAPLDPTHTMPVAARSFDRMCPGGRPFLCHKEQLSEA